jgi:putative exosortase-associated protein (TIGR04073 family)
MKKLIIAAIIFISFISFTGAGYCDDPLKKLGRGICNILTCPLEIVKQSSDAANADGPWAGLTYGMLKGVGMTAVRAVVGVYEVGTFPFPVPKDYSPILNDPEFFWEDKNW